MKQDKIFIGAGIIVVLIGLVLVGLSIFNMATYDKAEGVLDVRKTGRNNRTKAYVTYEYKDVLYEDVGLSSYNAFTMKDGKNCTIYINPEKPEWPKVTNYGFGIFLVLFGIATVTVGRRVST
ncbi:MAG: hypothetical protein IJP29_00285 [Lachnospiraceae bacterium]|nr:hypothetical protein [Lachnospiraceae bacterium]